MRVGKEEQLKIKNLFKKIFLAVGQNEYKNAVRFANHINKESKKKKVELCRLNILLGYGGGKDSTWALAFTRLTQLICKVKFNQTFNLQIITMVHLGTPKETLKNIDSVFSNLGIFESSNVIAKLYCYGSTYRFYKHFKISKIKRELLREDILMAGHLVAGEARPTFCYSCNLHMLSAMISQINKNIHFVITGDSKDEIIRYKQWVSSISNKLHIDKNNYLRQCVKLWTNYYKNILPKENIKTQSRFPKIKLDYLTNLSLLPIFDFTSYKSIKHLDFLKKFLKFKFTDKTLNFTETDCRHPLLMCHLRGLKAEMEGEEYVQGVKSYLELVSFLMQKKDFPQELVDQNLIRYDSNEKIIRMRKLAERYANKHLNITKDQLICMVYTPIIDKAKNLKKYINKVAPVYSKKIDQIHNFLGGGFEKNDIKNFLLKKTGLDTKQLKFLYKKKKENCVLKIFSAGDPHKKQIIYTNLKGKKDKRYVTGR